MCVDVSKEKVASKEGAGEGEKKKEKKKRKKRREVDGRRGVRFVDRV